MPSTIVIRKKLDMTPGAVPTVVHRSQYDSDFTIIFELFARTGEFVIESGTTARLRGTKTSGTGYSVEIPLNISTKTVTITGDAQMTVAAGENIFEVVLYQGDLEICSSNFVLAVERAAMDMDTITDETVVPELERLDEYIEQAADIAAREGAAYAESWAVGGTGKREDEDTNNAKYWAEQAEGVVHGVTSFNGRTGAVVPAANDYTAAQIKRSGGTVESALASVESVNMNQNSRLTGLESTVAGHGPRITAAENSIASQGERLTTAEGDIDSLETRATTAESNITTLQSNKVDMTTPLLNFDDTAVDPTTDDGALANALTALGILSDVIPSGGDALYLKKVLTKIIEQLTVTSTSVTLNATYAYTSGDTIKLVKVGKIVTLTIGILKALPNATVGLGTIPEGYRPTKAEDVFIFEPSATGASKSARVVVNPNGAVTVYAYGDYSGAAIVNAHTRITYICA